MLGIVRIRIQSDWHDWRTEMAERLAPTADTIYRRAFREMRLPLADGLQEVECTKNEAQSRYDWQEGIDVLLYFEGGGKVTLQEKFLTFPRSTLTFEEAKTSGEPGAWYYCTAQYYFVGYARKYLDTGLLEFQDWMLVDLPALRRLDGSGLIHWGNNENPADNPLGLSQNRRDGRRASFRFVDFRRVPAACIVAQSARQFIVPIEKKPGVQQIPILQSRLL